MSEIFDIIHELRLNSSTLRKEEILRQHKDNALLKEVFHLTENPLINFYIKADKEFLVNVAQGKSTLTLDLLREVKEVLAGRMMTGNTARAYLDAALLSLNAKCRAVLIGIINRDLECNTGTSLCNKVWKGLIPEMPCMLASKLDEKSAKTIVPKKDGYVIQKKLDGGRVMFVVGSDGAVTALSRNGKELTTYGRFDATFSRFRNVVFDGELVVRSGSGVEDRKTGNGFFTKAVRGTIKLEEAARFHCVLWDAIPLADFNAGFSARKYTDRLSDLLGYVDTMNPNIVSVVESKFISNIEQAQAFYEEMLAQGEEGAVLKFADMPWEDRRSKKMIKLKEELDIDAEVVSVTEHKKINGWVGALTCKTSDGLLTFDVGSGFTDADRQKPFDYYVGKIVKCKYNAVISNKSSSIKSLFLPVFVEVRHDKKAANSLAELK